jgi:hypothetical protein
VIRALLALAQLICARVCPPGRAGQVGPLARTHWEPHWEPLDSQRAAARERAARRGGGQQQRAVKQSISGGQGGGEASALFRA